MLLNSVIVWYLLLFGYSRIMNLCNCRKCLQHDENIIIWTMDDSNQKRCCCRSCLHHDEMKAIEDLMLEILQNKIKKYEENIKKVQKQISNCHRKNKKCK